MYLPADVNDNLDKMAQPEVDVYSFAILLKEIAERKDMEEVRTIAKQKTSVDFIYIMLYPISINMLYFNNVVSF